MLKEPKYHRCLFIDSSSIEEVKKWNATGIIDGVTTNQYILLKDGIKPNNFRRVIKKICWEMKDKPVSVELPNSSLSEKEIIEEAKYLNSIANNIVIKIPIIPDTLKSLNIIYQLAKLNMAVNATIIMTFEQMLMATSCVRHCRKMSFVSLFYGRSIEDHAKYRSRSDFMAKYPKVGNESEVNSDSKNIISATADFIKEGGYKNIKIIAGSIRTASMVGEAFAAGANIVTMTPDKLMAMLFSQRTIETIQQFDEAWKEIQKRK